MSDIHYHDCRKYSSGTDCSCDCKMRREYDYALAKLSVVDDRVKVSKYVASLESDNARLRKAIEQHKVRTSIYEEREQDTELYKALEGE